MCCGTASDRPAFQRWGHQNVCMCGCDEPGYYRPRILSRKQRITNLEAILENLQEETQAVKEEINRIKKEK